MEPTFNQILLTLITVLGVPLFTWITKRDIDRRAASEEQLTQRLKEQREDFNVLLDPLKEELSRLREENSTIKKSVEGLEQRLDDEERDNRLLLATLFEAVEALANAVPPIKIYLPARVQELLKASHYQLHG